MVQNRLQGTQVYGRQIVTNLASINSSQGSSTAVQLTVQFTELNKLNNAPVGTPVFGTITNSCDVYTIPIHLHKGTLNSSGLLTTQAMAWYHITDSAGVIYTSITTGLNGASGADGVLVFPTSTANYASGRIITNSTGRATIVLTSTGTSTFRVRITLVNGLVTTGTPGQFT